MQNDGAIWGPTYGELSDPASLSEDLREAARLVRLEAGDDPLNLYNLHWMDDLGEVTALVLPSDLTGVSTPIALMLGEKFPARQVHTAAGFALLMEHQLHQEIRPGTGRLIVPSTGAFGLGAAWAARVMGYPITAVIPKSAMSGRGPALEAVGAQVVEGGEGPADVLDHIDAAWAIKREHDVVLSPYDDFAPYRYHAVVTASAVQALAASLAASGMGRGRVSAFVAPTGAGGLLAAGDGLPGTAVLAAEPAGCAPLADGSWEAHDVADTGPRVPLWADHVMALDGAVAVSRRDLAAAVQLFAQPSEVFETVGLRESSAQRLSGSCGPAACLAVVAALKAIRYYGWGSGDLVVVAAPEGQPAAPGTDDQQLHRWLDRFHELRTDGIQEATNALRQRWHHQKYGPWVERRGKGADALRRQQDPDFWAEQRRWSQALDQRIVSARGLT